MSDHEDKSGQQGEPDEQVESTTGSSDETGAESSSGGGEGVESPSDTGTSASHAHAQRRTSRRLKPRKILWRDALLTLPRPSPVQRASSPSRGPSENLTALATLLHVWVHLGQIDRLIDEQGWKFILTVESPREAWWFETTAHLVGAECVKFHLESCRECSRSDWAFLLDAPLPTIPPDAAYRIVPRLPSD